MCAQEHIWIAKFENDLLCACRGRACMHVGICMCMHMEARGQTTLGVVPQMLFTSFFFKQCLPLV